MHDLLDIYLVTCMLWLQFDMFYNVNLLDSFFSIVETEFCFEGKDRVLSSNSFGCLPLLECLYLIF